MLLDSLTIAVIFLVMKSVELGKEHIGGACHDPLNLGRAPCDKQWEIRYHMDVPTETCLAFNFTGCDANWNNFPNAHVCYEECLPLDHQICPAASQPSKTTRSGDSCRDDCDCGAGKYCNLGLTSGQCCDETIRDQVDSDYNPKCPSGQSVVEYKLNGVTMKLVGKSCEHRFCPHGTSCVDGHFFAACCGKI